jgi:predicted ATPase
VPNAIAEVLHLHEQSGNTLSDTLKTYLRGKQMLLVLDNFEHLMDGAPYVSELLNAAPDLQIMVTSREVLHLYGEQEYPVPPMTLPESDSNLADITRSEAVALFVQGAQAVNPNFEISEDLAPPLSTSANAWTGFRWLSNWLRRVSRCCLHRIFWNV